MNPAEVYDHAFGNPDYCNPGPDEPRIAYTLAWIRQLWPSSVLDVGAGRGILCKEIRQYGDIRVYGCDVVPHAREHAQCIHVDLGTPEGVWWLTCQSIDLVTCLDVLEHLPSWRVPAAIAAMAQAAPRAVITVSRDTAMLDGQDLHLTRLTRPWWDALLKEHYNIVHTTDAKNGKMYAYRLVRK